MRRPNRSDAPEKTAPERCAVKILIFTYFAVTAVLLASFALLLTEQLWHDPAETRRLALTLCHTSFRLAVSGVVSGLISDIIAKRPR